MIFYHELFYKQNKGTRKGSQSRWRGRGLLCLLSVFIAASLFAGCETPGQIAAREQANEQARLENEARERQAAEAKRQAEEVRRQAEEARQQRIRVAKTAGDDAVRQGQPEIAVKRYQEALTEVARYSDQDLDLRQAIIKAVSAMPVPPALPEDVMRYMVRGETKVKMGGAGSYEAAAEEMEKAVDAAPWFADGYFNLGVVQEKAGKFNLAIQNLRFYLLAAPKSQNAVTVQAKIYKLEVMQEEAEKTQALNGTQWNGFYDKHSDYMWPVKLTVNGSKFRLEGELPTIEFQKKGLALEGFITIGSITDSTPMCPRGTPCTSPGATYPVTGTISEDGRSMEFKWMEDDYKWEYDIGNDSVLSRCNRTCKGVILLGKREMILKLVRAE